MIKHTSSKLQLAVLKLFNVILRVGYFPDIWNQGLITPIFKNGDKFDPNNYRGICVSSNLGKLFCSIINARLLDFITTHNVLSRSQIGFLPNYRTSDHIYTLHTLIERDWASEGERGRDWASERERERDGGERERERRRDWASERER